MAFIIEIWCHWTFLIGLKFEFGLAFNQDLGFGFGFDTNFWYLVIGFIFFKDISISISIKSELGLIKV